MSEINLKNLSPGLYDETIKRAKDGIDSNDINTFINIASKNGINKDEATLIKSFIDQNNVAKINNQTSKGKVLSKIDLDVDSTSSNEFVEAFKKLNPTEQKNFIELANMSEEKIVFNNKINQTFNKLPSDNTNLYNKYKIDNNYNTQPQKDVNPIVKGNDILNVDDKSKLENLLTTGMLNKTDKDGKSILQNLHDIAFNPKQKISDNKEVVKDAIKLLQPGDIGRKEITQCEAHFTCGSASIQQFMQKYEPAELIRIVKDLAASGKTTLKGGAEIKAGTGSLNFRAGREINASAGDIKDYGKKDGKVYEDRSPLDIIFQSAVMRNIALIGGDMTNQSLGFLDKINVINNDYNLESDSNYAGVERGNKGGHPGAMAEFLHQVTGKNYDYEHVFSLKDMIPKKIYSLAGGTIDSASGAVLNLKDAEKNNNVIINKLKESLEKSPKKDTVIVYGKSVESLHYVTALRFGKNEKGEEGLFFVNTMAKKENGANVNDFMTLDKLKEKLQGVIFEK